MVVYNGKVINPRYGEGNTQFVYHNGRIVSGYYDSNAITERKQLVVDNFNSANGYYLNNDGSKVNLNYMDDSSFLINNAFDTSRGVLKEDGSKSVWGSVYYTRESRAVYTPCFMSNRDEQFIAGAVQPFPPVRFTDSIIQSYDFGGSNHYTHTTFDSCTIKSLRYSGIPHNSNISSGNLSYLANNCNIEGLYVNYTLARNNFNTNIGVRGSEIQFLTIGQAVVHNAGYSKVNTNLILDGTNVERFTLYLNANTNETNSFRNGVMAVNVSGCNINSAFINTTSANWWNRPQFYINLNANFPSGITGDIANAFPKSAGYHNGYFTSGSGAPVYGIRIYGDTYRKAVIGEKNWIFYQPRVNQGSSRTDTFVLDINSRNTTSKAYIPNIGITGWTSEYGPAIKVNLNSVQCSNIITNIMTSNEFSYLPRVVNVNNSYLGYTVAGYCVRAMSTGTGTTDNTTKANGSFISNSIIASSISGSVTEFVHNDYSGGEHWNKNILCMNNVFITGLNTQIRFNAYTDQASAQNSFKFNRGNYFASNLNLYYSTWVPGVTSAARTTPANITFEFRTHWGGYWNDTYTNAMPVWNNMNGILRNVFSNIGPSGAKITLWISPQYYALTSSYANQMVLKNIFFGNDASATYSYTNANYGWINVTSSIWGQTTGINVCIRRGSGLNYANNRFYGNIYINTQ